MPVTQEALGPLPTDGVSEGILEAGSEAVRKLLLTLTIAILRFIFS